MIKNTMTGAKTEKTKRNRNGGFTMVETLVTASIIIILLAIGMAGIIRYRDYLRITELDNMARSIYVAAQNRAVLLDNDERFQILVTKGTPQADGSLAGGCTEITVTDPVSGEDKERWYIDSEALASASALDDLLPMGTIDPALRNGRFYIVYEPGSASVTDVFYVEKQDYDLNDTFSGIADALEKLGADDKREDRMKNKPVMVGWFGSTNVAEAEEDRKLSRPSIKVEIENGNELTLTVTYTYTKPADLPGGVTVTPKPSVKLGYGSVNAAVFMDESPAPLFPDRLTAKNEISDSNSVTCTYTWVLDSLAKDSKGHGTSQQFKDLGIGTAEILGGNFTVTASLYLTADGYIDSDKAEAEPAVGNSLFAEKSAAPAVGGSDPDYTGIARIANLRHLQNLDTSYSGVNSSKIIITKAEQIADIDAGMLKNNENQLINVDINKGPGSEWEFKPIRNTSLRCYQDDRTDEADDGMVASPRLIGNLKVTEESAAWTGKLTESEKMGAGLFGEMEGGFTVQNVCLADSSVAGRKAVGVLVGYTAHVSVINCYVKNVEVAGSGGDWNHTVGGLVGFFYNLAEFRNCEAEDITVKSGISHVGGLAGYGDGASFTECTVKGVNETASITGQGHVGGLIGVPGENIDFSFEKCRVIKAHVMSTNNVAGGMAGYNWMSNNLKFTDCGVEELTVEGKSNSAGGLIGVKSGGSIEFTRCIVGKGEGGGINITAAWNAGGLVGDAGGCTTAFIDCTAGKPESTGGEVTISGSNAGGLAGYTTGGVFRGCSANEITVKGADSAGGLAGNTMDAVFETYSEGGTAKDCTVENVTVTAVYSAGGLTGSSTGSKFSSCKTVNPHTAGKTAGGLAGSTKNTEFIGCTAESTGDAEFTVNAEEYAGGLTGSTEGGLFADCKAAGAEVTGNPIEGASGKSEAGGLTGRATNVTFSGCGTDNIAVEGCMSAGGLAGGTKDVEFGVYTQEDGSIKNCTARNVTVKAKYYAGGLAGNASGGSFEGCEAVSVEVTGSPDAFEIEEGGKKIKTGSEAGGLTGRTQGTAFSGCSAYKITVNGYKSVGGLAGSTNDAVFTNCTAGKDGSEEITVYAREYAGGLTGNTAGGSFEGCKAVNARVTGSPDPFEIEEGGNKRMTGSEVGGLTGRATSAAFSGCSTDKISVEGRMNVGGLAGGTVTVIFTGCTSKDVTATAREWIGGLVGNMVGGEIRDCEAVNAHVTVKADGTGIARSEAGGLAGTMKRDAAAAGCRVYWEDSSSLNSGSLQYQVDAETAGGLAGSIIGNGTIENSFAATLVRGKKYAGGLVGNLGDPDPGDSPNPKVEIRTSYADCYLQAGQDAAEASYAGGLAGMKSDKVLLNLENVYAAGFIDMKGDQTKTAAGLCGGNEGGRTVKNAYAAMYYTNADAVYPLAEGVNPNDTEKLYFLNYDGSTGGKTYEEMKSISVDVPFEMPSNARETHRYGLTGLADGRDSYPFPGLKDLAHYGDWVSAENVKAVKEMTPETNQVSEEENPEIDKAPEEENPESGRDPGEEENPESSQAPEEEESRRTGGQEKQEETPDGGNAADGGGDTP